MHVEAFGVALDLGPNPIPLAVKRWRGDEFYPLEQETLDWISRMTPSDVMYDIGASVGVYSAHAAVRGVEVVAFEPHEISFQSLCAMIRLNPQLKISAYNVALFDKTLAGYLGHGRSKYTFTTDKPTWPSQPVTGTTLADFVTMQSCKLPTYIKMDVDGNEEVILTGGRSIFTQAKSLCIEVDPVVSPALVRMVTGMGFRYDLGQVAKCMVKEGKYKGTANYIFYK